MAQIGKRRINKKVCIKSTIIATPQIDLIAKIVPKEPNTILIKQKIKAL